MALRLKSSTSAHCRCKSVCMISAQKTRKDTFKEEAAFSLHKKILLQYLIQYFCLFMSTHNGKSISTIQNEFIFCSFLIVYDVISTLVQCCKATNINNRPIEPLFNSVPISQNERSTIIALQHFINFCLLCFNF